MTHYTCDRCKSVIDSAQQPRYSILVEVHSVNEHPPRLEDAGDVDSLSILHQMLEGIESQPLTDDLEGDDVDAADGPFSAPLGADDRAGGVRQAADTVPTSIAEDELPTYRAQYELCPDCYRLYLRNPLGRDLVPALHFSQN